jgi:hypothetical protein
LFVGFFLRTIRLWSHLAILLFTDRQCQGASRLLCTQQATQTFADESS